ncbi:glutathione S-transferase family protein [Streptomyces sp. NPDC047990]|uniref:glutathione S-transferase family protein n=1 Tax=Streptomyces sp. NPDC047990 TaxID=3365496 RepID=UPI003710D427
MPETASLSPSAAASPCSPAPRSPSPVTGTVAAGPPRGTAPLRGHRIRSRIGAGPAGGFYPAPHRYQLYLSEDCPRSLRISITLGLLGLRDSVTTTLLTAPSGTPDARAALRAAYEATWHHYDGPLTAPALCDRWSGRIVSNHTPDILRDLGELPGCRGDGGHPRLHPPALAADIDALRVLLHRNLTPAAPPAARSAALASLDRRLAAHEHVLGDELTAADVDLWVALVRLGADDALSPYGRLREYVAGLGARPAFRDAGLRG